MGRGDMTHEEWMEWKKQINPSVEKKKFLKAEMDKFFEGKTFEEVYGFKDVTRDNMGEITPEDEKKWDLWMEARIGKGEHASWLAPFEGPDFLLGMDPVSGKYIPSDYYEEKAAYWNRQGKPGDEMSYGLHGLPLTAAKGSGVVARSLGLTHDILSETDSRNLTHINQPTRGVGNRLSDTDINVTDIILGQAQERYYAAVFDEYAKIYTEALKDYDGNYDDMEFRNIQNYAYRLATQNIEYPFIFDENNVMMVDPKSRFHIDNIPEQVKLQQETLEAQDEEAIYPPNEGYERNIINDMLDDEIYFE